MEKKKYQSIVNKYTPKENRLFNGLVAFIVGGLMGLLGQGLIDIYSYFLDIPFKDACVFMIVTLIFVGCLLTCFGFFDKLVHFAKCGLIVPITGFANGVAASAIEFKKEGQVFGIGCRIFNIAGPVILYGIFSSWVLGLIYWILKACGVL